MSTQTVIVVGAGFSGTLVSVSLQSCAPEGTIIHLIECDHPFGVGLAYRSHNPNHLLNVPAGRMGAFPDRPLDFLQWLQQQPASRLNSATPAADAFMPRGLYGAYLQDLLNDATRRCHNRLELVHDRVVDVIESGDGVRLRLLSGRELRADLLVLATGNAPPASPHASLATVQAGGVWQPDPWAETALARLDPDVPVLLVGTGLTMVDAVVSLLDTGHAGPIHALSRRGLLPRRHAPHHAPAASLPEPMPRDLESLVRWVRREARDRQETEAGWHPVIDALRPVTHAIWQGLNLHERRQFRRHLCAWWDVHRHRLPPRIADRVDAARTSGQLQVHAGRLTGCEPDGAGAMVSFRPRGTSKTHRLQVARILNCTGPCTNVTLHADPLMRSLLRRGAVRPDPLNLGLDVTREGAVVGAGGVPSRRVFAAGPLTRSAWWEITSVPDIRNQCRELARLLSRHLDQANHPATHAIS